MEVEDTFSRATFDFSRSTNANLDDKTRDKNFYEFSKKLRQDSTIDNLRAYIQWQREIRKVGLDKKSLHPSPPEFGPSSINLDLTVACNHRCPHCVDIDMLNKGPQYELEKIKNSIDQLVERGLRSVILIGGGEPTLHRGFTEMVKFLKSRNLQVGLVTNGTMMDRVIEVAEYFKAPDWIRLSLDAARQDSFQSIHLPKGEKELYKICSKVRELKEKNPNVGVGFSFIVIWEGCEFKGVPLTDNVDEIPEAVSLAYEYGFDYISFKPFLLKMETEHGGEGLFRKESEREKHAIIDRIKGKLDEAERTSNGKIKVTKTLSMVAALENSSQQTQPKTCHMQAFRQVLTPIGIYHCPAYRAESIAQVGLPNDYSTSSRTEDTINRTYDSIRRFRADKYCANKFCFYHSVNHWIESFIKSDIPVDHLEVEEDFNAFL